MVILSGSTYREILRLHSLELNKSEIASSCQCARNTVAATLQRAANCGLQWPLPEEMSDKQLSERLFPSSTSKPVYKMPDYASVYKELQRSGVTLNLLWLGLKAVKAPSTSCESCQALSALFPIAGARAANTAEKKYTAGYDANGKAITKNVLGKTQAEVKDKLRTAIEDSKKLDPVKAGSYTLEQWLKLWYSVYVEPQVRYSTKEFYHNAIDHHIIPKLGNVKLEKLTMLQIQQFYNELLKSGRVQKKNQPELKEHGLSPRMVQCVHVVLNKALEHAVEEKLILANPAKKCKIPKNMRKEMNILPEALIGPYLSAAKEHGIPAPMYLELTTGLRRGELLALRWEDLDIRNRTLSINKSVARQNGKLVISTPKTPNSIRTVLLPEDTVKLLVEEHERHPANSYLFPSPRTGETWDPDGFRRLHDRIIKEIGAEHVRFHDMRHTFATLALKNGVDVRTLSETLGHFSAGFTLSTYVHSTSSMKQSAADAIGNTIRNAI